MADSLRGYVAMAVLIPTGQEVHDLAGHGLRVLGWSPEQLGLGADVTLSAIQRSRGD